MNRLGKAADRFGHIRGSYYDMVSGVAHNVAGIVDPRSQYAQWSLESNRGMTFYTPMGEMMQPQGLVYVLLTYPIYHIAHALVAYVREKRLSD